VETRASLRAPKGGRTPPSGASRWKAQERLWEMKAHRERKWPDARCARSAKKRCRQLGRKASARHCAAAVGGKQRKRQFTSAPLPRIEARPRLL